MIGLLSSLEIEWQECGGQIEQKVVVPHLFILDMCEAAYWDQSPERRGSSVR